MLIYPQMNPIALQWGPLKVHWYAVMYLLGFAGAWLVLTRRAKKNHLFTVDQVADLIFYGALGVGLVAVWVTCCSMGPRR